ncbi:TPA: hypothetical protein ACGU03_002255 [Enterococcus faecium]|uniref:hypothetical protein n=1 Tax=Enterococcus faecium TaxID=1352 RepID=UPI0021E90576|nr:hypothetical protein [Enterococcus faecium]MCV3117212.1 hypothetical protein [Enterococcus faecium]MCV3188088.1 hypothetical protein [Enterococcus faecium]
MRTDTRTYLTDKFSSEDMEKIERIINSIEINEKKILISYVELTRHISELDKLFNIFRCNLTNLFSNFIIYPDDYIEKCTGIYSEDQCYYQINALIINLISSAKTFIESIEVCMKNFLSEKDFKLFKQKFLSKPYDEVFSYRFLLHMRNYSQHGHLPLNIRNKRVYFDLNDILDMPHFDLNKLLKEEIKKLKVDIYNEFGTLPYISYVYTISRFNLVVTEIYVNFLNEIKAKLVKFNQQKNELLNDKKFYFINPDGTENDMIFYDYDGEVHHCFNYQANSMAMYAEFKKEAKKFLKVKENYFTELHKKLPAS